MIVSSLPIKLCFLYLQTCKNCPCKQPKGFTSYSFFISEFSLLSPIYILLLFEKSMCICNAFYNLSSDFYAIPTILSSKFHSVLLNVRVHVALLECRSIYWILSHFTGMHSWKKLIFFLSISDQLPTVPQLEEVSYDSSTHSCWHFV